MMDENLETQYPDFKNIMLNTCLASLLVYHKDPIGHLNNDPDLKGIQHELEDICVSRNYTEEENVHFFNKLCYTTYMIAKNESKKRIIVAFRGVDNVDRLDIYLKMLRRSYYADEPILSGFYKQAENVPVDYFVDKYYEGYQLIFTGHSFGAIVAAFITIKLISMLDITKETAQKILFVGYGCPSIIKMFLNDEIKFQERFIFAKNKCDILVDMMEQLQRNIFKFLKESFLVLMKKDREFINIMNEVLLFNLLILDNTDRIRRDKQRFGCLLQIDDLNNLIKQKEYSLDFPYKIKNCKELFEKSQYHTMENYFLNLKKEIFKNKITCEIETQKYITLNHASPKMKSINVTKNENNIYIYLTMDINPSEYVVAVRLDFESENNQSFLGTVGNFIASGISAVRKRKTSNEIQDRLKNYIDVKEKATNSIFKFNCPTSLVLDKNGKINQFRIKLYSHFSQDPIEIDVNDEILKSVKITDEFTHKYVQIQDMPFDLLYVHAAVYIHLITRMQANEGNNQINHKFIQAKDELLELFAKIDQFAEVTVNYVDQNELTSLLSSYLKYQISDYEEKNDDIQDFLNNIEFVNSGESLLKLIQNSVDKVNSSSELLRKLISYVYEIKIKICRSTNNSEKILEKLVYKDNYTNKRYAQLINGELTKVLTAISTSAAQKGIPFAMYFAKKYKKDQLKNENDNFLYKLIVELMIDDDVSQTKKYLGEFEKSFTDGFINSWEDESDKKNFQIIQINSRIRDILCQNFLIGVIGTKKAGKSTFVELITGKDANSSATDATIVATPYTLSDQICLVDYPHINSSTISHKIEFIFSRLLLDHVIMIFDAKMKGETKEEKLLLNQVSRHYFQNYTIFYNNSDFVIKEQKQNLEDNFKTETCANLETTYRDKIHFTCMSKSIDNLKEIDSLIECSIVLRDELIKKFNNILANIFQINKHKNYNQSDQIEEFRVTKDIKNFKKISVCFNDLQMSYTLHQDKNFIKKENDFTNFADFNSLYEEIKYYFRLRSEFTIHSNDNKQMQSLEDFFNHKYHCFKLILKI